MQLTSTPLLKVVYSCGIITTLCLNMLHYSYFFQISQINFEIYCSTTPVPYACFLCTLLKKATADLEKKIIN